jgi:Rrf2 family protein
MMKVSRKTDYGLVLLADLIKKPGEWVALSSIAKNRGVSEKFMSRLATSLYKAGIVISREGAKGGYRLARQPREITMGDIIHALEGETSLVRCLCRQGDCRMEKTCDQKKVWSRLQNRLDGVLTGTTLADMTH